MSSRSSPGSWRDQACAEPGRFGALAAARSGRASRKGSASSAMAQETMTGAALVRLTHRAYRGRRALKVSRGDGFDGRSHPLLNRNKVMTWAFTNRDAGAPIQCRPIRTESLHGDSVGLFALKTCCRHTSAGQELGRLAPGRGRCGGLRPPMIQVTVPPVRLPCPSCSEPMG